jgi:hypothetical protein
MRCYFTPVRMLFKKIMKDLFSKDSEKWEPTFVHCLMGR